MYKGTMRAQNVIMRAHEGTTRGYKGTECARNVIVSAPKGLMCVSKGTTPASPGTALLDKGITSAPLMVRILPLPHSGANILVCIWASRPQTQDGETSCWQPGRAASLPYGGCVEMRTPAS